MPRFMPRAAHIVGARTGTAATGYQWAGVSSVVMPKTVYLGQSVWLNDGLEDVVKSGADLLRRS